MRSVWAREKRLDWDDCIPKELGEEWKDFFKEMLQINSLSFRRCLKPENAVGEPSLIIFADCSQQAYGTVAYARWATRDGKFSSYVVASNNRIAPVKIVDIVRLELAGAVQGKRLRSDTMI